jgi:hypothetical protein
MNKITDKDYEKILEFYKMPIPKSKRILKKKAEKILAIKLCRCIKQIGVENEARSIGICTKTVLNRKGLARTKFTCKKKQTVSFSKIISRKNKSKKNKSKKNKKN